MIGEIYNAVILTCFAYVFANATGEGAHYVVDGIGLTMIAAGRVGMFAREE